MPTRLVIVRHGESVATVERFCGGPRTCRGLSQLGFTQARALADRLVAEPDERFDAVVSSQFPRAVETADVLVSAVGGGPIDAVAGFGEHDPGPDCDGLTWDAIAEKYGELDWTGNPYLVGFPGGETIAQFQFRVGEALGDLLREHRGRSVMLVCHGGVVDAIFRQLMNLPATGGFYLHTINTSLTEFVLGDTGSTWKLVRYNDAAHLSGIPHET